MKFRLALSPCSSSPWASHAERVTAAVAQVHGILDRATAFVSEYPSDEANRILALARSACDAAVQALEAERWVPAAQQALR